MTISFRTTPTPANGTTTALAFTLPTGHTTNDVLIAYGTHKAYTVTISSGTVTTDYTALAAGANGAVANGAGVGSNYTYARYRIHDGSESNPTGTLSAAPSPRLSGMLAAYSNNSGSGWDIVSCKGSDTTTTGTTYSVTGDVALAFAPGDVLIVISGGPDDTATPTALALSASGITFSAVTSMYAGVTATGNDASIAVYRATVTAGTATVAPAATMTTGSGDSNGQTTFIRLREPLDQPLAAASIASTASVGATSLAVGALALSAATVTVTPTVGATSLSTTLPTQALVAVTITATPTVGATSLAVGGVALSAATITASPTVGATSLAVGGVALSAATITASPTVGATSLSQTVPAFPQDLTAAAIVLTSTVPVPALDRYRRATGTVTASRATGTLTAPSTASAAVTQSRGSGATSSSTATGQAAAPGRATGTAD